MTTINTGGPAFPCAAAIPNSLVEKPGMTLRDYFAGQALNGILSGPASRSGVPMTEWFDAPEQAYKLADAMIAERERNKP